MRARLLMTAAMAILISGLLPRVPAGEPKDAVASDLKRMQGDWILHSFVTNGREVPAEKIQRIKLTIKGDHYLVDLGKQKMEFTFKLDPTKKPKAIDLVNVKNKNKTATLGIYEVGADTLKFCRGTETGQERPTEFAAKEGSGLALAVYKRAKK